MNQGSDLPPRITTFFFSGSPAAAASAVAADCTHVHGRALDLTIWDDGFIL